MYFKMNLTEDDVLGAKLKFTIIKDNTVADLKRWFTCPWLKKNDLIARYNGIFEGYVAAKTFNVMFVLK